VSEATVTSHGGFAHDRRFVLLDERGRYVNGKLEPRVHALRVTYDETFVRRARKPDAAFASAMRSSCELAASALVLHSSGVVVLHVRGRRRNVGLGRAVDRRRILGLGGRKLGAVEFARERFGGFVFFFGAHTTRNRGGAALSSIGAIAAWTNTPIVAQSMYVAFAHVDHDRAADANHADDHRFERCALGKRCVVAALRIVAQAGNRNVCHGDLVSGTRIGAPVTPYKL
jgi:hypothetical protein